MNSTHDLQRTVIVAMAVVRMVQAALNEKVHMIAMRHSGVATIRPVNMLFQMARCAVSTPVWIRFVHRDHVFIHVIAMHMMEMAIVQIIRVAFVFNRQMPTAGAVLVRMVLVFNAFAHKEPFVRANLTLPARQRKEQFCNLLALVGCARPKPDAWCPKNRTISRQPVFYCF